MAAIRTSSLPPAEHRTRRDGTGFIAGGGLWVITGLLTLSAADGSGRFYLGSSAFVVAQALVLLGFLDLLRTTMVDGVSWGRRALLVATAARVIFLLAEITSIVVGKDDVPLFPLAALLTAFSMVVAGIATIRAGHWQGWARYAPLVMGVYPFVAMFPLLAINGARPDLSVALWGTTIVALGAAMRQAELVPPMRAAR